MTLCCRKKNVGKPCEGEPHARFDEGRMKISSAYSTNRNSGSISYKKREDETKNGKTKCKCFS